MNENKVVTIVSILCLLGGIGFGYMIFSCPKPDPMIEVQLEAEKQYLRGEAQKWTDSANYYKHRVDTIIIEREKLKTIKQYEKGLANASLDSLQRLLLSRPTVE